MTDTKPTDLAIALDRISAQAPTHTLPNEGIGVVLPPGYSLKEVPPLEPPLTRIKQTVRLHDADSFVAYLNRFKRPGTQLFAEPGFLSAKNVATIAAPIDYHLPETPDRCCHLAIYEPRYSEAWQRWQRACNVTLSQVNFAELIEECRADIVEPAAANLLDIVRAFKASKKVEFDSVVYQANGDVRLTYNEHTEQRGSSGALPERMTLGIPVYFRDKLYEVPVFVRYKVDKGAVQFALKLDRADVIEDAAFKDLAVKVGTAVGIEPYLGRRE